MKNPISFSFFFFKGKLQLAGGLRVDLFHRRSHYLVTPFYPVWYSFQTRDESGSGQNILNFLYGVK